MFNEMDHTQLNPGMIFLLAECPQCSTRFAVTPDPFIPGQSAFFQRDRAAQPLSHISSGGLLCLRGHALVVTHRQAVLTQAGEWLNVEVVNDVLPILN